MNMNEARDFIKDNSRLIRAVDVNTESRRGEPIIWEFRRGDNGTAFMLMDMGKDGWELYLPTGSLITKAIDAFCKATGVAMPAG